MTRLIHSFLTLAGIFILSCGMAEGSIYDHRIHFNSLGRKDGLPQISVLDISQDSKGFIWFATRYGVSRFDGEEFESYSESDSGLSDNYVTSLSPDSDGKMWVGTSIGMNLYDPSSRDFTRYQLLAGGKDHGNVRKLFRDSAGRLWAGTTGALFSYDAGEDAFKPVDATIGMSVTGLADGLSGDELVVAGVNDVHILRGDTLTRIGGLPDDLKVRAVMRDGRGNLWIATTSYGLFCLNRQNAVVSHFSTPSINSNYVRALARDLEGNILIGTYDGLNIYTPETGRFKSYRMDERSEVDALSFFSVISLFCAGDGTVWVGSYVSGVNYFNPYKSRFIEGRPLEDANGKGIVGNIGPLVPGKDGLWIGTEGGGLLYGGEGTFRRVGISGRKEDYRSGIVSSICRQNGFLWVGFNDGTVAKLDSSSGRTLATMTVSRDCPVIAIFADIDSYVYAGTWGDPGRQNLAVITPRGEVIRDLRDKDGNSILFRDVSSILPCPDGSLLVSESDGDVSRFDFHSGEYKPYAIRIPGGRYHRCGANQMIRDRKGNIWIASNRYGLIEVDGSTIELKGNWSQREGLPSTQLLSVAEGEDGCIWCSSISAVTSVNPETGEVRNFEWTADAEFNRRSIASFGGIVYLGARNSLVRVDPGKIRASEPVSAPVLISVYSGSVRQALSDTDFPLKLDRHSALSFYFRSPEYVGRESVVYAYKIDGLDKEWVFLGRHPRVNVAGLSPGTYVLRTRAGRLNDADSWTAGDAFTFKVRAPLWMRWYMLLLYITAATLTFFAFSSWRNAVSRLDEERARLGDICYKMFRQSPEVNDYPAEGAFMQRLYKSINDHISDSDLNLKMLVEEIGISRTGLYYKVKKLCGMAPMDYVRKVRLDVSAELLRDGRHTVGEIADLVGFSNSSHFSSCFKARYGCSPSEYVRKQDKTNINNQS